VEPRQAAQSGCRGYGPRLLLEGPAGFGWHLLTTVVPNLALALCVLFVLFLLRLDSKQARGVSRAVWVPTIWVLYCASRPIANWFGSGGMSEVDAEAGSAVDRAFLGLLILLSLIILIRRNCNWQEIIRDNAWLFALLMYMGVSAVWSDFPLVSCKRWIKCIGSVLMALAVFTEPSARQALASVLRRSVYVLIPFSVLLVKYFDSKGRDYNVWTGECMWLGVTPQKNCLGRLCFISAFFILWEFWRRRQAKEPRGNRNQGWANLAVLGMALWLLKGSSSATSLAVLGLGVLVFIGLCLLRNRLASLGMGLELVAVGFVGLLVAGSLLLGDTLVSSAAGMLGRDPTFTGRTDIWKAMWPYALKNPLVGLGYGSFWVKSPLPWAGLNEGHNGYLDVFLELGVAGLLLLLGFLMSFYRKARMSLTMRFDWAAFNLCFLLMAMVHNLSETSFARSTTHLWTIMLFLAILSSRLYEPDLGKEKAPALCPSENCDDLGGTRSADPIGLADAAKAAVSKNVWRPL
jgi:exopolysaccharide production protein ExoQ